MIAGPVAGILGNPLSALILQFLNGAGGLAGWQWVFLLEGLPAVVMGVVTLYYLTDRPAQAQWLTLAGGPGWHGEWRRRNSAGTSVTA